jgi:hypothetical protein
MRTSKPSFLNNFITLKVEILEKFLYRKRDLYATVVQHTPIKELYMSIRLRISVSLLNILI